MDEIEHLPLPDEPHESPTAILESLREKNHGDLANYLELAITDDPERFLHITDIPDEGFDIGYLIDWAIYFGMVYERERPDE